MPDIPLRLDADPQWQAIHAIADAQEFTVARLVYAALFGLVSRRMVESVLAALIARDADRAVVAIPTANLSWLATTLEPILAEIATRGTLVARAATRARLAEFVVRLSDADLSAEAADWARRHAGQLIRGVESETRFAVRRIIEQGVHQGVAPIKTAELIANVVGLTNRQAQAVKRFAEAQVGSEAQIARVTSAYARMLLQHRARMIARTETLRAANEGRRAQWEREAREGLIDRGRWEREWVAVVPSDGRTCPYCEEQDEQRAPIDGVYPDGSSGPPGHPACRCTEKLVRIAA